MSRRLKDQRQAAIDAHRADDAPAAMAAYAAYLAERPDDGSIWSNLGVLHRKAGRYDMALRAQQRAVAADPGARNVQVNLANILSDLGRYDESIAIRRALLVDTPNDLNQLAMIGRCLRGKGDYAGATAFLTEQVDRHPQDAELQIQLAFAQLGAGDYVPAFTHYKARWKTGELSARDQNIPEWQGEPLDGKTLLVLPEQGFGDALLFARFLPVLRDIGGKVHFVCEKPLARLFDGLSGADHIKVGHRRAEAGDYWINMMDLALLHFERYADVPAPVSLAVPSDSVARAKAIVAPHRDRFKVGVVWTGSETYKGNAFRSFSHRDFLPLVDALGVQLFSLYKGPALDAYKADGTDAFIIDTATTDRDFADCAATMQQMDLIVTSDTATAHLAGSLGLETWVALHWDPFWVFSHHGDRTEWYPSIRLFRQPAPRDWDSVMAEIADALRTRLESRV
ncbi:MAG: tetratricopeptide repeat protein [Loktanella sp.]|nr:tetratricopeptide repeat protein [Loktanella sp.]